MSAQSLYFTGPEEVVVRERSIPDLRPTELLVESEFSAISAGTERLVYAGDAPETIDHDEQVPAFVEEFSYPMRYGYATVGRVSDVGADCSEEWVGRRVFAYNPHESAFVTTPDDVIPVPAEVPTRHATLLANAETAVTFLLDGQPALGERVTVFGQGVVGLLTTGLLSEMAPAQVVAVEPVSLRRELARTFGANQVITPDAVDRLQDARPDLTYELSGNPDALDDAIAVTGYDGRIVVGSWYGTKPARISFGGRFHRHRLDITSSQVSTIAPRHAGRWSRERRHAVAWDWLTRLPVDDLFTHELPLSKAPAAYELVQTRPNEAVQVLFTY